VSEVNNFQQERIRAAVEETARQGRGATTSTPFRKKVTVVVVVLLLWFFWPVVGPWFFWTLGVIWDLVAAIWNAVVVPLWYALMSARDGL
jgi:hypothetical protein